MKQHLRHIHPLAWTIIIGTMFGRLVTSMSIPFLSIYLTQVLGASATPDRLHSSRQLAGRRADQLLRRLHLRCNRAPDRHAGVRLRLGLCILRLLGGAAYMGVLPGEHAQRTVPRCI